MPKVTEEHRLQRRTQIEDAAWDLFSRNGFHGTSMADVIKESGMSAGAVYLYFTSKDELILSVVRRAVGGITGKLQQIHARTQPTAPIDILGEMIGYLVSEHSDTQVTLFPLITQVWSEASRPGVIRDSVTEILATLGFEFRRLLERWTEAGNRLPSDHPTFANALMSLAQGYVIQFALSGQPSPQDYLDAVRPLLTTSHLAPSPS